MSTELISRNIVSYGWKPQVPDYRDHRFLVIPKGIPASVDLRTSGFMPAIYDQGQLGSCVANAVAGAFEYELKKQRLADFIPSRLFIYYNGRVLENSVSCDCGLEVRDGLKVVNRLGVCSETEMPYNINTFITAPTTGQFTDALKNKATQYMAVMQSLTSIKAALSTGYPVVFGFTVYNTFESIAVSRTGIVPMPTRGNYVIGGHSMVIVGYNDAKQQFLCRNSWGTGWGNAGYCYMPYAYLTNSGLASDFWVIQVVTENNLTK